MKKALITGITGFAGSHLTQLLLNSNINVTGIGHPDHLTTNIDNFLKDITLHRGDLKDKNFIKNVLTGQNFDFIFHLAAYSSPPQSFEDPKGTIENNLFSQMNLLDAAVISKSTAKILIVGSSDEYGDVDKKNLPVKENTPLAPTSPYAVSKVAQDFLGLQYFLHNKLNIVRVRPFNHIGPKQSVNFVVPSFASQIARLEKNGKGKITTGNLETYRDFTDVRDMVKAYLLALEKGKIGEVYNLGSSHSYKIADILKTLISFSKAKIEIKIETKLFRSQDIKNIYCDYTKFKNDTGWHPEIKIDKTLFDTIEYERNKLKL